MSAQPSPFAPQYGSHVFVTEREARRTKREHQQLQHVINRMTSRMGFPDKAARGVAGIHGLLNGRETFPALIAHKWAARQFNYKGKEENTDVFMGRYLEAIKAAEQKAGRKVFEIERANRVTTIITTYHADYIGEAALWALVEARKSEAWKKHPAAAVTDELIDAAIAKLPPCKPPPAGEKSEGHSETDGAIIAGIWTRVKNLAAGNLTRIAEAGGDPVREVRIIQREFHALALEAERVMTERDRKASQDEHDRDPADMWGEEANIQEEDGKDISDNFSPGEANDSGTTIRQTVGCQPDEVTEPQQLNDSPEPNMLEEALKWALLGVPVGPLHEVYDDICTCSCTPDKCHGGEHGCGSECENKGKHPRYDYKLSLRAGFKSWTTDPEKIRRWWAKYPHANIGGRMGGDGRLGALDFDPKNGGDASLHDLVAAHGDEWTRTRTHLTGSRGYHFLFTYPEGVTLRNSAGAVGPGVDTRAEGGYIVLPPSLHASRRRYEVIDGSGIADAPAFLLDVFRSRAAEAPPKVVNFQERRERGAAYEGGIIPKGERNETLFKKVACSMRARGAEYDEILSALRGAHARCERAKGLPTDRDLISMAARVCRNYPAGSP